MNLFNLFTDGGAWPNPGSGAWAFIIKSSSDGSVFEKDSGTESNTTNNRMELTAVIEGLRRLPCNSEVTLYSDSQYVVNGIMKWRIKWMKKNWNGVLNPDLWKTLSNLVDSQKYFEAIWVRGHDGHPENEECDRMCLEAYR